MYAFKPTSPLSFVDPGVDAYVGVAAFLEAHRENDFNYRPARDATAIARFGQWTAAAVLQVIMPLLIILLGFSSFTGERENGTLRQVLSVGVSPRDLLLGKSAGMGAVLLLVGLPAVVIGALAMAFAARGSESVVDRALWLVLVYTVYGVLFAATAVAVSAHARSSRTALLSLLGFWAMNALVAPRALSDLSRSMQKVPSSFAFNRAMENELAAEAAKESAAQASDRARPSGSAPLSAAAMRGRTLIEGERRGNAVFDLYYGRLHDAFARQTHIQSLGAIVVPLTSVRLLSMSLSGTDYEQHWEFAQAAERYRRDLVGAMNIALVNGPTNASGAPVDGDSTLWRSVAPFSFTLPTARPIVARERTGFAILAVWLLCAIVVAFASVGKLARHSDVT